MAVILVAEDEPAVRDLVKRVLESAGHEVMAASNGVEAVALFRSYPDAIDLVITDITMPVMDGIQAALRIRETRSHVRIVCMSSYSESRLPSDVLFLSKPFLPAALLERVAEALEK